MMYGPDPTPFSDWWKTRHRPRQHPRIADDQYRLSGKSVVQGLLGMLPSVGEAMDAWDVGAGLLQKDPKRVGAGLLGAALPFVTGRALRGVVDDLPMDETSRMARAREMGFDVDRPVYHGTGSGGRGINRGSPEADSDFREFDTRGHNSQRVAGAYFAPNPEAASRYASGERGRVYPVVVRGKFAGRDDLQRLVPYTVGGEEAREILIREGFSGVDDELMGEVVVFDPRNIRSRFARFDPRRADSADLLAGVSGLGLLGAYRAQRER